MAITSSWQFVTAFYLALVGFIYYHRNKFEFQGKVIALYKTDIGIEAMRSLVQKRDEDAVQRGGTYLDYAFYPALLGGLLIAMNEVFPIFQKLLPSTRNLTLAFAALFVLYSLILFWYRPIERAGYHGIIVGYVGMAIIVVFLAKGVRDLFLRPDAPPVIAPIIPGVDVPGSPITIPLISGLLSLFFVIVIHEFSHGVVSKSHGVPIESSGFLLFGPIPGAFVEPNEEQLEDQPREVQNAVFAAGPYSNALTGILAFILFIVALQPGVNAYLGPNGYEVTNIKNDTPAAASQLEPGTYNAVNGKPVNSASAFIQEIRNISVNETVTFQRGDTQYSVRAGPHPQNASRGYLGIDLNNSYERGDTLLASVLQWILKFFNLFVLLSFGLGLANLLPLGPVDGGRMFHLAAVSIFGEERGEDVWTKTTVVILTIILVLLINSIVFEGILGL